ncbi:MAG: hypothetical protein QM756_25720 [Polyangiaceae bacterium]
MLEVLLPWPVRWAAVGGLIWATSMWQGTGVGQQLSWGLQVGAFCLVAIIATFWALILGVDVALAVAWFIPFAAPEDAPRRWPVLHVITFVNRQIEHIKALLIWTLVAFTHAASLTFQLGLTSAVFLLAPPLLNGLARLELRLLGNDGTDKASGGLYWRRRVLIYIATLVGLATLAFSAPGQLRQLSLLLIAFAVGVLLRVVRHLWWRPRQVEHDQREGQIGKLSAREKFRVQQAQAAQHSDSWGSGLVLLGVSAVVALSWWQRQALAAELAKPSDGTPVPVNACSVDPDPPSNADIALFLLADTQTHELSGERFPGQTELATVFARTATRPVVLDMLSSAPVRQFQGVYRALVEQRRASGLSAPLWGHLGDMADLGCAGELERMLKLLEPFQQLGPLAGIAIGNHETAFEGSFHWSPYWDSTCRSQRMLPSQATEMVRSAIAGRPPAGRQLVSLAPSFFNPAGALLASVVPLGVSRHKRQERGIIGIFLHTTDGRALDWGNPGSYGSVSREQIEAVEQAVAEVRKKAGEAYAQRPAYVMFSHVPLGALAGDSQARVHALLQRLDEKQAPGAEPRVLAWLSAHTHVASSHQHCVGGSYLREVVIGSTVDPPQQSALVQIGPNQGDRLSLSVRTLTSVARPVLSCGGDASTLSAATCRSKARELRAKPECAPLLAPEVHGTPPRDCQDLEHAGSLSTRLSAIRTYQGPRDAKERRRLEEGQARALLECICHDDATCKPSATPLADESYLKILQQKLDEPSRQAELVCLAWAAGAMQAHKDNDMTMSEAMRCAFDDPTLPAERVSVARLEATTCY